jgi:hypothetical protein
MMFFKKILIELVGRGADTAASGLWPCGMTTIIGLAFFAAMRLSRMKLARPTEFQA